jgi:hypothetical protein
MDGGLPWFHGGSRAACPRFVNAYWTDERRDGLMEVYLR